MDRDELVWRLEEGLRRYRCLGREQKVEGIQYALATIFEMEDEQADAPT